jgi:hypothetical protein
MPSPARCHGFALAAALLATAAAGAQPPESAATPAVPVVAAAPSRALFDLGWDSGKPLSIRSD